ncbi:uncharacterized protein LOC122374366 [Amphibalanus amphitrite]|uniref:uncharacterized protein LOC122374366 n=1 Tax=Amphibalanus amphitrite TaxID=1232801 RepID=UPI001C91EB25|nr:uncharacterized protein LOC122374366 [Amphibalanus amphitrite]XP_043208995.1 uncharacterized protein LOC122374366 [Amphibalanus amphitrite]
MEEGRHRWWTAIVTAVLTVPEQQRRTETAERHRAATSQRNGSSDWRPSLPLQERDSPSFSTSLTTGGAPVLLAPPAVAVLPALIVTRRWRALWYSPGRGSTYRTSGSARRRRWRH